MSGVLIVDDLRRAIDRHGDGEEGRELEAVETEALEEGVRRLAAGQREVDVDLRQQLVAREAHLPVGVGALLGQALQIEPVGERDGRRALDDRSARPRAAECRASTSNVALSRRPIRKRS